MALRLQSRSHPRWRSTPAAARAWLAAPHTVKNIGATYPGIADAPQIRLAQTHDVVIHLPQVEAAHERERLSGVGVQPAEAPSPVPAAARAAKGAKAQRAFQRGPDLASPPAA
ncbi:hypothetical protein AB0A81_33570 [Streptomyces flaveolus]|uniref:hypothetical protein n=1 Tax=Streptomyces flaveolus TaxID=67297 RepID=UPI00332EB55E